MKTSRDKDRQDRALWRRYREALGPSAPGTHPAPDVLAAWLAGTATPEEVEQVERALAADPEILDTVVALRELERSRPRLAPPSVIARARALMPAKGAAAAAPGRLWPRGILRLAGWQAAAAAVAVFVMGPVGFQLGRTASRTRAAPEAPLPAEIQMIMEDMVADPGLATLFTGNGAKGGPRG